MLVEKLSSNCLTRSYGFGFYGTVSEIINNISHTNTTPRENDHERK